MLNWLKNLFGANKPVGYNTHLINGYPCYRGKVQNLTAGSLLATGQRIRDIILYRASMYGKIYLTDGSSMAVSFENSVWIVDEGILAEQLKARRDPYCKEEEQ